MLSVTTEVAARYIALYWGGAMVGRFVGAALMNWIHPGVILGVNSICAMVAVVLSVFSQGEAALWAIVSVGFFNSKIYAQNVTSSYSTGFHDVTSGKSGSYSAGTNFDLVTGWGSPKPAIITQLLK